MRVLRAQTNRISLASHAGENKIVGVKIVALLLCTAALLFPAERDGNFIIRFEPTAVLQTNAPIPFQINVTSDLRKPLLLAKVTLHIEMAGHKYAKAYTAPSVGPSVYVAKPVFPVPGDWDVQVEVRQNDQVSSRTIQYNVPEKPQVQ
ncbi:MAG: hypothetical protein JOY54_15630 [Acidobacteriaceae bacterium]|nr:hypothetical protein [Acidobacteriaceae bacterium]